MEIKSVETAPTIQVVRQWVFIITSCNSTFAEVGYGKFIKLSINNCAFTLLHNSSVLAREIPLHVFIDNPTAFYCKKMCLGVSDKSQPLAMLAFFIRDTCCGRHLETGETRFQSTLS